MTADQLTAALVERVMNWTVCADRFRTGDRAWMPRWKFQPTNNIVDAFRLLEGAAPQRYRMDKDEKGIFRVEVQIGNRAGLAEGLSKPHAITYAVARALGMDVPNDLDTAYVGPPSGEHR